MGVQKGNTLFLSPVLALIIITCMLHMNKPNLGGLFLCPPKVGSIPEGDIIYAPAAVSTCCSYESSFTRDHSLLSVAIIFVFNFLSKCSTFDALEHKAPILELHFWRLSYLQYFIFLI